MDSICEFISICCRGKLTTVTQHTLAQTPSYSVVHHDEAVDVNVRGSCWKAEEDGASLEMGIPAKNHAKVKVSVVNLVRDGRLEALCSCVDAPLRCLRQQVRRVQPDRA